MSDKRRKNRTIKPKPDPPKGKCEAQSDAGRSAHHANAVSFSSAAAALALSSAQGLISHQSRLNMMSEQSIAEMGRKLIVQDPVQIVATKELLYGDTKIDLSAAIALAKAMIK